MIESFILRKHFHTFSFISYWQFYTLKAFPYILICMWLTIYTLKAFPYILICMWLTILYFESISIHFDMYVIDNFILCKHFYDNFILCKHFYDNFILCKHFHTFWYKHDWKFHFNDRAREGCGSVEECLTWDRRAVGSSRTGVTVLWSLSKTHLS